MNIMFPLIAITAFFVLGIAFFAFGKDDFGIKRVNKVSAKPSTKEKESGNTEVLPEKESNNDSED
tara:strand:+ start:412 stop:606 length:195 start_codon:yes stop_codon:yes gene_type:complete